MGDLAMTKRLLCCFHASWCRFQPSMEDHLENTIPLLCHYVIAGVEKHLASGRGSDRHQGRAPWEHGAPCLYICSVKASMHFVNGHKRRPYISLTN